MMFARWIPCLLLPLLAQACDDRSEADSRKYVDASVGPGTLVELPDGGVVEAIACDSQLSCPPDVSCSEGYCDLPVVGFRDAGTSSVETPPELDGMFGDTKPPVEKACRNHTDCEVAPVECCTACAAPYSAFAALTLEAAAASRQACAGTQCEQEVCADPVPKDLVAVCQSGSCELAPLGTNRQAFQCKQHDDCRVRTSGCCECEASSAPGDLIAVSNNAAYENWACIGQTCGSCTPSYPSEVQAVCIQARCNVADPRQQ